MCGQVNMWDNCLMLQCCWNRSFTDLLIKCCSVLWMLASSYVSCLWGLACPQHCCVKLCQPEKLNTALLVQILSQMSIQSDFELLVSISIWVSFFLITLQQMHALRSFGLGAEWLMDCLSLLQRSFSSICRGAEVSDFQAERPVGLRLATK